MTLTILNLEKAQMGGQGIYIVYRGLQKSQSVILLPLNIKPL